MAYTGRKTFLSMRERKAKIRRKTRYGLLFAFVVLIAYIIWNRVDIWDYIKTFFY